MPSGSHMIPREKRIATVRAFICSDHAQTMFVRNRSIDSTASCLSRERRSDSSSLIAENSCSTLTCATGSAASARLQGRTAVGYDGMKSHTSKSYEKRGGILRHPT